MIGGGRYSRYELTLRATSGIQPSVTIGVPSHQQETIPTNVWNQLMRVSAIVRNQPRVERVTLEGIIVQLCAITPLGINDLVKLLGRKRPYIQGKKVLPSLITSGRISYLYPNHPSHPRQRYVAAETVDEGSSPQQTTLDLTV